MSRKKRRHKRQNSGRPCKRTVARAALAFEGVRDLAADHSLTLKISTVHCKNGRVETDHWMFNDEHGRALDYWPGKGTIYSQRANFKSKARDPWEALDQAARISAESLEKCEMWKNSGGGM